MSDHQLPEGYKQTEVGVIPEDWEIFKLRDVIKSFQNGYAFSSQSYVVSGVPIITMAQIGLDGTFQFSKESVNYWSTENFNRLKSYHVKDGDIIISMTDVTPEKNLIGRMTVVRSKRISLLNQRVGLLRLDLEKVNPVFLTAVSNQRRWREYSRSVASLGVQANIGTNDIKDGLLVLPSVKEQQAIATVLSEIDALIAALDKLIAKKRHLKTATMQQLLTGKKRLPGFGGNWQTVNMNKYASLKARIGWQALTTEEYLDSGFFFLVTGTDFLNGKVNWSTCHFVDEWRYSQDKNIQLKNGDVLLTKDGTIGKVGYVESLPNPATLNSGVFVIRPLGESFYPLFLYYILSSQIFDAFLNKIFAGSTISHLYQKDFVTFEFLAPSSKEQQAIATVLSDMDAEITALETRRAKTQAIKQGMMQELLTGRTRLV
jgi:type I restriction enzyme, S subunit